MVCQPLRHHGVAASPTLFSSLTTFHFIPGSWTLPVKDQPVNMLSLQAIWFCPTTQLCHYSIKVAIDDMNRWLWLCSHKTLFMDTGIWISYNFHKSWNIIFIFFSTFRNLKTILGPRALAKQTRGHVFLAMGLRLDSPALYSLLSGHSSLRSPAVPNSLDTPQSLPGSFTSFPAQRPFPSY